MPRHAINNLGSNFTPLGSMITGNQPVQAILEYQTSMFSAGGVITQTPANISLPIAISQATVAYFNGSGWSTIQSGLTNGAGARYWGASIYDPKIDSNLFIYGARTLGASIWSGLIANDNTIRSGLNVMPFGAQDAVAHDHRLIMWNVRIGGSSSTRAPTRLQWSAFDAPMDWTSPGAGYYDITDMRGYGTRCFAWGNEIVLATTHELWRATPSGRGAYEFSPIDHTRGIPLEESAICTPDGIFWLGTDAVVYRYAGQNVEPIGQAIMQTLRQQINFATSAYTGSSAIGTQPHFGWDAISRQLLLFYVDTASLKAFAAGSRTLAFAYSLDDKVWMPQRYPIPDGVTPLTFPVSSNQTSSDFRATLGMFLSTGTVVSTLYQTASQDAYNATAMDFGSAVTIASADFPVFQGEPRINKFANEVRLFYEEPSAASLTVSLFAPWNPGFPAQDSGTLHMSSASSTCALPRTVDFSAAPAIRYEVNNEAQYRVPLAGITGATMILRLDMGKPTSLGGVASANFAISNILVEGQYGGKVV